MSDVLMATRDRRRRRRSRIRDRKDRLIQTRVAEDLEQRLKDEAAKRRLTVSHLIRNTLEDAFNLVEDVTNDVGQLVTGSVELAAAVSRDARRFASMVRGIPTESREHDEDASTAGGDGTESDMPLDEVSANDTSVAESPGRVEAPPSEEDALAHVYGWNRVVANRDALCARCSAVIRRGDDAMVGLSDDPTKPRAWLCAPCSEQL
jgi:hypothetical protein